MTDINTLIIPDHPQSRLHRLFDRNFLDYTAYVIRERAIPDIMFNLRHNTGEQHGKDSSSSY